MKRQYFLFSIFLLFMFNTFGQKKYFTKHPIYLDVIKQYIYVYYKNDSTIRTNYGDQSGKYIRVFNLTDKGSMKFIFVDTIKNLVVNGEYKQAIKLSKPKDYRRNGVRVTTKKEGIAESYYKPFREGIWCYYNISGDLIQKEVYKDGILSSSSPKL